MKNQYSKKQRMYLKKVGQNIREIRESKGFSQEALAMAAGLDRSYMGSVERGERNVSVLNLDKIAQAMSVKVKDLL